MRKAHFGGGTMDGMTLAYLVQHGEKEPLPGDPGLTRTGRAQAARAGQWLLGAGVRNVCTSPMRRARRRLRASRRSPVFRSGPMTGCGSG
jgi:hypothetical protein